MREYNFHRQQQDLPLGAMTQYLIMQCLLQCYRTEFLGKAVRPGRSSSSVWFLVKLCSQCGACTSTGVVECCDLVTDCAPNICLKITTLGELPAPIPGCEASPKPETWQEPSFSHTPQPRSRFHDPTSFPSWRLGNKQKKEKHPQWVCAFPDRGKSASLFMTTWLMGNFFSACVSRNLHSYGFLDFRWTVNLNVLPGLR